MTVDDGNLKGTRGRTLECVVGSGGTGVGSRDCGSWYRNRGPVDPEPCRRTNRLGDESVVSSLLLSPC